MKGSANWFQRLRGSGLFWPLVALGLVMLFYFFFKLYLDFS